jgi:hypothetical protein
MTKQEFIEKARATFPTGIVFRNDAKRQQLDGFATGSLANEESRGHIKGAFYIGTRRAYDIDEYCRWLSTKLKDDINGGMKSARRGRRKKTADCNCD